MYYILMNKRPIKKTAEAMCLCITSADFSLPIPVKLNKKAPHNVVLKVQMNHRLLGVYKRANTLKTE